MRKITLILSICLLLIAVQPVALSDNGFGWDGNELCGILGVITIVVVIIIGLFIVLSDSRKKQLTGIEQQQRTSKYCINCGREIPYDANICPYCGVKI